jgi:hypothetical protein
LIDNVLVSLSIYYSIKAGNLLVFCSILDETLDFLLAILEVTSATIVTTSIGNHYAFTGTFYFYSHNFMGFRKLIIKFLGSLI